MKQLWAPWRMEYITDKPDTSADSPDAASSTSSDVTSDTSSTIDCPFCAAPVSTEHEKSLLLYKGAQTSVIMNRYPYSNGHLMVSPLVHTADFTSLDAEISAELFNMTKASVRILTEAMAPEGFNVGLNLGEAAGAGIAEHLHMHIVPRWSGDTNFMPVLSDIKVMPEHLGATYARLKPYFDDL
ncbi:MAG: HIT domain-containing protein [Proteobacteria bacterium]|nr:HIT domain-containing protein [Pseudomonadota bacterium]